MTFSICSWLGAIYVVSAMCLPGNMLHFLRVIMSMGSILVGMKPLPQRFSEQAFQDRSR